MEPAQFGEPLTSASTSGQKFLYAHDGQEQNVDTELSIVP